MYTTNKIHTLVKYGTKIGLTVCTGNRVGKCNKQCMYYDLPNVCDFNILCGATERTDKHNVVFILLRDYTRRKYGMGR